MARTELSSARLGFLLEDLTLCKLLFLSSISCSQAPEVAKSDPPGVVLAFAVGFEAVERSYFWICACGFVYPQQCQSREFLPSSFHLHLLSLLTRMANLASTVQESEWKLAFYAVGRAKLKFPKQLAVRQHGFLGGRDTNSQKSQLDSGRESLNSLSLQSSCPWSSNSALHTPHTPSRHCPCKSELPMDLKWNIDFPALGYAHRNVENAHESSKLSWFSCWSGVCLFFQVCNLSVE